MKRSGMRNLIMRPFEIHPFYLYFYISKKKIYSKENQIINLKSMSKGKNISIPTSVESQIRTRARNLPVHKCYVNQNWQKTQIANIVITRKHTNGNITIGGYFVDLKLQGVKDCVYSFNESPLQTDELVKRYPEMYQECDYELAHNIIHAGLEFAGDYGFEPHKDFKIAQYILEEDTDDIPLMEIPLGDDGVPVLELHPGQSGQHEIALLKKTAGANFRIVYFDEKGKSQPIERTYDETINEMMEKGFDKFLNDRGGELDSQTEKQALNDVLYMATVYTDEERKQIDEETKHIYQDPRLHMNDDNQPVYDYEKELNMSVKYFEKGETDKAQTEFRKVINRHPDDPLLWHLLLYNLSIDSETVDEKTVKEAYGRFPEHPIIKAWYAEWLAQEERTDEVFALFNHLPGLDALSPENIYINAVAIPSFCFAYAMAWLQKEDIRHADPYYQLIVRLELDYRLGIDIQDIMFELRRKKLDEKFGVREEEEV